VHFNILHSFFMISFLTSAFVFVFFTAILRLFGLFLSVDEKEGAALTSG
jgi:hypothetical protein